MTETGVFPPESRVELIRGELIEMTPQSSRHYTCVRLVEEALRAIVGAEFDVRVQGPLALSSVDLPEPDVSVVVGHARHYADSHPSEAVLVVEISDTSLAFDQGRKLRVYARAGVANYLIVNLQENLVELYTEPAGDAYRTKRTFTPGEAIPLPDPFSADLAVADIIP